MDKRYTKRYAMWAIKVVQGELNELKVREWLRLGDYHTWIKEYLEPAKKLKGFTVTVNNLINDMRTYQFDLNKLKIYNEWFGKFISEPTRRLLDAIYKTDEAGKFSAFIEGQKRELATVPDVIKPLFQKNIERHEEMLSGYRTLEDNITSSIGLINEYAGMQLFNLIGIL